MVLMKDLPLRFYRLSSTTQMLPVCLYRPWFSRNLVPIGHYSAVNNHPIKPVAQHTPRISRPLRHDQNLSHSSLTVWAINAGSVCFLYSGI